MNTTWRDFASTALVTAGGVIMFAKLQEYSWWLIGSWKGALGVLAAFGAGLLIINIQQLLQFETVANAIEIIVWAGAIAMVTTSMLVTTTKAEFIVSGALFGIIWLGQLAQDAWDRVPTHHGTRFVAHQ